MLWPCLISLVLFLLWLAVIAYCLRDGLYLHRRNVAGVRREKRR